MVENMLAYLSIDTLLLMVASAGFGIAAATVAWIIITLLSIASNKILAVTTPAIERYRRRPPAQLEKALGLRSISNHNNLHAMQQSMKKLFPESLFKNIAQGAFMVLISLTVFVYVLVNFKNIAAGVIASVSAMLLMAQLFSYSAHSERRKLMKQLPAAIRIFASVFEDTGNFRLALDATANRTPDPIKRVFRVVIARLDSRKDAYSAFEPFEQALGKGYATVLRQLFDEAYRSGTLTVQKFLRLSTQVENTLELELENAPDVSYSRVLGTFVYLGMFAMVFAALKVVPDGKVYLTDDPVGRVLMSLLFLAVTVGILADKIWNEMRGLD